jgi:hypothetical protein
VIQDENQRDIIMIEQQSISYLSSIRDATTQYTSSAAAITLSDAGRLSLRLPWLVRLADMLDAGDCEAAFVPARGDE